MALQKEAYKALQSIVGPEYVSDDPAVCEADRPKGRLRDKSIPIHRPAGSIEPISTEEVQAIIKVCNRYHVPFACSSSYGSDVWGIDRPDWLFIDLKRMRKFEIDEQNLYAVVESGIASAALQAECMKRNLLSFVPMSGGECSVLGNASYIGEGAISWKLGDRGYRRVLGVEWVTPEGDIMRLGSLSMGDDYFCGEGPGPDLRGLLISSGYGSAARKGVITRIGVRIFPFIKEKLVPTGDSPTTVLQMPSNRFAWYNFTFPSRKACADAIYEIGRNELGLLAMTVPPWFVSMAKARATGTDKPTGAAGFWYDWNNVTGPKAKENPEQTVGRILLYGIGSDKRLAYEEKVLMDICQSMGAVAKKSKGLEDQTHFMSADAIVSNLAGGRFASIIFFESLDSGLEIAKLVTENTKKRVPKVFDDHGTTNWYVPFEMAHITKMEALRFCTVEFEDELTGLLFDCHSQAAPLGAFPMLPQAKFYGPVWGNYPETERKIFRMFDPNGLAPF